MVNQLKSIKYETKEIIVSIESMTTKTRRNMKMVIELTMTKRKEKKRETNVSGKNKEKTTSHLQRYFA